MGNFLLPLDRLFNRLYTSKYNPLYRSGSISVGFLIIAFVSGLYLSFFYRLGEPYESVLALQTDPWFGSWIRSLHRYASDAMVVSVIFHVLRMLMQKKTWGPRTLAWVSGVFLLILMLVSGWTGFVMVWDEQAQAVAAAGARIFDSLGIFADPIGHSFNGVSAPPASFFFLNLFLHIVLPLLMIFGLWIHTSKIARSEWLPEKSLMWSMAGVLVLVSLIWPASLGDKANLLELPGSYPLDWFFNFWVPWVDSFPLAVFLAFVGVILFVASIPWWLKPSPEKRPGPSFNDPKICQGCSQCVQDCPYEAISMVDMLVDDKLKNVAQVDKDLCVSCGICAASCAPFTIGPEGRKAGDQLTAARKYLANLGKQDSSAKTKTLIVGCRSQAGTLARLEKFSNKNSEYLVYPVDCAGTIHNIVFERFSAQFEKVVIAACPGRNCTNKDGYLLLTERLSGKREPTFTRQENRDRVVAVEVGEGEEFRFFNQLKSLKENVKMNVSPSRLTLLTSVIVSVLLLLGIAGISQLPTQQSSANGVLRLSFRLSGQSEKTCRPLTADEIKNTPQHMRTKEICDYRALSYKLILALDGKEITTDVLRPGGLHNDRPIYVSREFNIDPGSHQVQLALTPLDVSQTSAIDLSLEENIEFQAGRVVLMHLSPDQKKILVKESRHE